MKTLVFDENCIGWTRNFDINREFLKRIRSSLNEALINRGYVYLNQIYEYLYLAWNPDDENICYRKENGFIDMRFKPMDNGAILVEIH